MLILHMSLSLLSYGAFLVAFVAGMVFLIQERQLKGKRMGVLFHRLPPLGWLDRVNFWSIGIGFGLLSAGVICGLVGAHQLLGRWWTGDPKEYLTVLLWSCYLALWLMRYRATLRGRRVALLSVLGFSLVAFTFWGANRLFSSMHPYL
jgi:ABC-type uncharacterized transport system permease subunit